MLTLGSVFFAGVVVVGYVIYHMHNLIVLRQLSLLSPSWRDTDQSLFFLSSLCTLYTDPQNSLVVIWNPAAPQFTPYLRTTKAWEVADQGKTVRDFSPCSVEASPCPFYQLFVLRYDSHFYNNCIGHK